MTTIPYDTRKRILARYDAGKLTRAEVAEQFDISVDFVKKILKQRKRLGHARPLYGNGRAGRRPTMTPERMDVLRDAIRGKPDLTLEEMRGILGCVCTTVCIHFALKKMRITYKKKRYALPSRIGRTCANRARSGSRACPRSR
jgi:transposase